MSDAIVKAEQSTAIVVPKAFVTRALLADLAEQRQILAEFIRAQMKDGVDYGKIPGVEKRTLFKAGAEKLTDLFRCSPSFEIDHSTEDADKGLYSYTVKCTLTQRDSGAVLAQGLGSASTYESKYRWRKAERTCPVCGKAAIIRGKQEFGGGFVCWKKKEGCGEKFNEDDPDITSQPEGRAENPDLADQANTVLKMAKKRSHVDAAIALAGISDLFTQDVGDDQSPDDSAKAQGAGAAVQDPGRDRPVSGKASRPTLPSKGPPPAPRRSPREEDFDPPHHEMTKRRALPPPPPDLVGVGDGEVLDFDKLAAGYAAQTNALRRAEFLRDHAPDDVTAAAVVQAWKKRGAP